MKKFVLVALYTLLTLFAACASSDFLQLQTDHFTFIFEPEEQWAALELSQYSDNTLHNLSKMLDHFPDKRIPVILSSRPPLANGAFSPIPSKIILYITSDENRFIGSRTAHWLHTVFTHELTHFLHLTSPVGWGGLFKPIFGPEAVTFNGALMPGWWVEGITTYSESTYSVGGRGDSPTFALSYQEPIAHNRLWSIAQGGYSSPKSFSGRIYTTGYVMIRHLMEKYGEESFAQINKRYSWWPFFGLSYPMKKVVGKGAKELFEEAVSLEKESLIPSESEPLFTDGDYYLPITTKRGLIGAVTTKERGGSLLIYEQEGIKRIASFLPPFSQNNLTSTTEGTDLYFSHLWIDYYDKNSLQLAPVGYSDLYHYNIDSKTFRRVTTKERLKHPAISGDGELLVAIEQVDSRYRLVEIRPERKILYENPKGSLYEPQISVDSSLIVAIETEEGNSSLRLFKRDGSSTLLWPLSPIEIHSPRFIDEDRIWFSTDASGKLALYEYTIQEGRISQIFDDPIGVMGAVAFEDSFFYQTYSHNKHTLKKSDLSNLYERETTFPSPLPVEKSDGEFIPFTISPYKDTLRFNFWLPFPIEQTNFTTVGATALFGSLLSRHNVLISSSWDFSLSQAQALLSYTYTKGATTTALESHFEANSISLLAYLQENLLNVPTLKGRHNLAISTIARSMWDLEGKYYSYATTLFGSLGYLYQSNSTTKDLFGRWKFLFLGSLQYDKIYIGQWYSLYPYLKIEAQTPLGFAHQALSFKAEVATPNYLTPSLFESRWSNSPYQALITLEYHLPLGLLDQPIPYGGITKWGLSLQAQKLLFLSNSGIETEKPYYIGSTLTSEVVIGSGYTLSPFATVVFNTDTGEFRFTFGLGISSLIGTKLRQPWH